MPHRIHKCTNTLYDYDIINTYVSLVYELKKMESYLRVNLLGLGPLLIKKRVYRATVSQRLRNTDIDDKFRNLQSRHEVCKSCFIPHPETDNS
jgi:hypothetical protein